MKGRAAVHPHTALSPGSHVPLGGAGPEGGRNPAEAGAGGTWVASSPRMRTGLLFKVRSSSVSTPPTSCMVRGD